jgi:hypothetical protein
MCSTSVHSETVDNTGKTVECRELGFSIVFPPGAVGSTPVTVSVCCSFKAEFSPPDGYEFVSPVYVLHVHPVTQILKKVTLTLQHWAKSDGSDLCFGFCTFPNTSNSYQFQVKEGGGFVSHESHGRIEVDHFSVGTIIRKLEFRLRGALRLRNYYRACLVWPLSTTKPDVNAWLYALSLSLDHNCLSRNSLEWMKNTYPGFVWRSHEKRRLDLEPEVESFTVKPPPTDQGISIKGPNTISKYDIDDTNRLDEIEVHPPRVFLEAKARYFTDCSVSIHNVCGCTFKLTQPSDDGVHLITQDTAVATSQRTGVLDLNRDTLTVKGLLAHLEKDQLKDLFLELGLFDATVQNKYSGTVSEYAHDLIRLWIQGKDDVLKSGGATWENLKKGLTVLNHHGIAEKITT